MAKVVIFSKRRKDLSFEQFRDHWVNVHNPLERKVVPPGLKLEVYFFAGKMGRALPADEFKTMDLEPPFDCMVIIEGGDKVVGGELTDEQLARKVELFKDELNFLSEKFLIPGVIEVK